MKCWQVLVLMLIAAFTATLGVSSWSEGTTAASGFATGFFACVLWGPTSRRPWVGK